MPKFIAKRLLACRSSIGRPSASRSQHPIDASPRPSSSHLRPASDEGFLLIEVIMSALLVGFIVIATLTGFDVTNRLTAEQRRHNVAATLAAESQEQLRSDPASTLDELQVTPHEYKRTVNKVEYTIKQEVGFVNDKEQGVSCEASNAKQSSHSGDFLRIASTVTWAQQIATKRPAVRQASIITPPVGSALEVDVGNYPNPTAGVAGITAIVKYTPVKGSAGASLEATTGTAGCVIFGAIPSTEATLEILERIGFVTPSGALKWPTKEVTIAPNLTTHEAVTLNEGGAIEGQFTYKGATTANVLGEGAEVVTGDTFVVSNPASEGSQFQVASTAFQYESGGEEKYAATTGGYAAKAITAGPGTVKAIKYPRGDLFPFPSSKWTVVAGDCTSNNTGKEAVDTTTSPVVEPGKTSTLAKVPLSYVKLSVLTGKGSGNAGTAESKQLPVAITNTACAKAETPNNAWGTNYLHTQETTPKGHLTFPFQPFGKASMCVYNPNALPTPRSYTFSYENLTAEGTKKNLYLGQRSEGELTSQKTEEAAAKTKREKEESEAKPAKEKREKEENEAKKAEEKREKEETEMAAAKTAREKKEKEEREKWLAEEKAKTITKTQRTNKEKTQKTAREAKEKEEKTAKEKREKEETEAKTAKTKREKEETEAEAAKTKRVAEETAAKPAKEKREKEETEAATSKAALEKETKEAGENGVTVVSGASKC